MSIGHLINKKADICHPDASLCVSKLLIKSFSGMRVCLVFLAGATLYSFSEKPSFA